MNERSVLKIISGGQTGADRAAMDFALRHGFESGGFVPLGRSAEDGNKKFSERDATIEARRWLKMICPNSLNIAGPRASEDSEIYCAVTNLLEAILGK